jgi:hypothetical protein
MDDGELRLGENKRWGLKAVTFRHLLWNALASQPI